MGNEQEVGKQEQDFLGNFEASDKIKRVICSCTNREMTKIGDNEYLCGNCNCKVSIEFEVGELK